jgi:hypothetical protein
MIKALDQSYTNRVADIDEHNRNRRGLMLGSRGRARTCRYQDFGTLPYQLNHFLRILTSIPRPYDRELRLAPPAIRHREPLL